MSKVLVAYATNSGSTAEVAEKIAAELSLAGHDAVARRIADIKDIGEYDSVLIGAPMILGWQAAAKGFARRHQSELAAKKVAYFACAMRLTHVEGKALPSFVLALDPNLAEPPARAGSLSLKERFTLLGYYLKPMLQAAPRVKPLNVAFFKGKLEMYRLKWYQALFVMIVVQASPGDYRDWDFVKGWARSLSGQL